MIFKALASGSKGNSSLLKCGNLNILIDVGINYKTLSDRLNEENMSPSDLDIILITHTHSDHIKGLSSLIRKTHKKVYIHQNMLDDMLKYINRESIELLGDNISIDDVNIKLIPLSHDVIAYGFVIDYADKSIVYITDTGYINKKYYPLLTNKNIYLIEANHDVEMLMNGPYPYYLKQRVVGDYGHLSNEACGHMLKKCIGKDTRYVLLAHISENNNTKDIAYNCIKNMLEEVGFDSNNIIIADQYESSELIEV